MDIDRVVGFKPPKIDCGSIVTDSITNNARTSPKSLLTNAMQVQKEAEDETSPQSIDSPRSAWAHCVSLLKSQRNMFTYIRILKALRGHFPDVCFALQNAIAEGRVDVVANKIFFGHDVVRSSSSSMKLSGPSIVPTQKAATVSFLLTKRSYELLHPKKHSSREEELDTEDECNESNDVFSMSV
jgi:hypothetical protein